MIFEEALAGMRGWQLMRRANWKAYVGRSLRGPIAMWWPSGYAEAWRPTLADIQATDWERVK